MKLGLKHSLREKFAEWVMSAGTLAWGIFVLYSPDLFIDKAWYHPLLNLMPQIYWGLYATSIGIVRLIFLYVNGALRKSAHIRALGSALSLPIWGGLLIGSLFLSWLSAGIATYCILLSMDVFSLWFAAEDAKIADIKATVE